MRVGNVYHAGILGLPRPDVKLAHPSATENPGFEIRSFLPVGPNEIFIEVQVDAGDWITLTSRTVSVQRRLLPLWLGDDRDEWTDLIPYQTPTHLKHPPHALRAEKFPPVASGNDRKPKLSIVTPSFQQARYLPETLRSVLEQTHITCEYVVQDGGSIDGSAAIIRAGAASPGNALNPTHAPQSLVHLISWESARDEGQGDAIVRGFAKTSGGPDDLMAWINSDDFYLPGALAFVVDYFAKHPYVDAIYGHRVLVDENSCEIGRWFLPKHDDEVLKLNDFVPQETLFWRRRIWEKAGGLDKSFKFAMDWDLLLRFQASGARIVRVPYFLACFRIHPAQKTSSAMHSTGQSEITALRERTFRGQLSSRELEENPRLLRYLRRSAWIEFLWKFGIRAR